MYGDQDSSSRQAADLFLLLGGGVPRDFVGLPTSRLAVLPGISQWGLTAGADLC